MILAIESSCDDTAVAVWKDGVLKSNVIANQSVHREFGGVVPELASRAHLDNIVPVVSAALKRSGTDKDELDAIAFTVGPGLLGSLMVGVSFAKALSLSLDIPMIKVNHLQAHVLSHFIEDPKPKFPFLCLTVSGGHTQIVLVKDYLNMEIIGQTRDDAAGEAFDKTGKMLGLEYPSGPIIDRLAKLGNPVFSFPKPRVPDLDYSFSGLKTAVLYFLRDSMKDNPDFIQNNMENICASVQHKIIEILFEKLELASERTGINEVAIAGGVSANSGLRKKLDSNSEAKGWSVYTPKLEYCTDNAGMIAVAGYYKYLAGEFTSQEVAPKARLPFI